MPEASANAASIVLDVTQPFTGGGQLKLIEFAGLPDPAQECNKC